MSSCHGRPELHVPATTESLAALRGTVFPTAPPRGCCCVGTKRPLSGRPAARASGEQWSGPPRVPGASLPSNHIAALRSPRGSRPRSCGSHPRAPPTPAAPTAQEGGPRPAAPVTFEPGASRPSDPRAHPQPRGRRCGRAESDAAGHLPFSPALPAARWPRRLRRIRGHRLPLRSSRSFLFPGSLGTRPGRGAGEAVTGPADRTPTPGVHHRPGSRPAQASPLLTATHSARGGPAGPARPAPNSDSRVQGRPEPTVLKPARPTNPDVHCAAQGPKVPGSHFLLQIPASTAPPGSRHRCPPP